VTSIQQWVRSAAAARLLRIVDCVVVVTGVLAIVIGTDSVIAARLAGLIDPLIWIVTGVFAAELALRLRLAGGNVLSLADGTIGKTPPYLATPAAWFDIAAVGAVPLALLAGAAPETARLFGLIWALKLARYSSGLSLLARVIRNATEPLVSVFLSFAIILIGAATLAYLAEGAGQPEQFGSIPLAMWWAVVTLTTTGYGDATPVSLAGRVLAGAVMICGIGVFALWAGIIASGFAEELRRRDFLRTWDLVSKVPFFRAVGAGVIGDVARLLKRRDVAAGQTVVRRGQPGEAMFFIVSGELEVQVEPRPVRLGEGQFFGELALITGAPRSATVVAAQPCVLLELDVADFRQLASDRPELLKVIGEEAERRTART
jgi:voltage-gated potassium channel